VLDVYDCGCPTPRHYDTSYYHNFQVSCCVCVRRYNLIDFFLECNFYSLFIEVLFFTFSSRHTQSLCSYLERNSARRQLIQE
jgi:hypothetical protein